MDGFVLSKHLVKALKNLGLIALYAVLEYLSEGGLSAFGLSPQMALVAQAALAFVLDYLKHRAPA